MLYGNGFFGILEANYALASVHFISAAIGPQIWDARLGTLVDKIPSFNRLPGGLAHYSVLDVIFAIALLCMSIQKCGQVHRVLRGSHSMTKTEQGHKDLGVASAIKHFLYIVVFFVLSYLFLVQPLSDSPYHARGLLLCVTISYATIATQLIMDHMAKEPFIPAIAPYIGLFVGVLNWVLGVVEAQYLTYGIAGLTIVMYLHYVVNVIMQVCDFLGIRCLTIEKCN
jgi:ethanolaminephosphotransferase